MEQDKVYLGQMSVFGYELTVVGRTKEEALGALKKAYKEGQERRGAPYDESTGKLRSFNDWADYAGMTLEELPFGHVEWL